MSIGGNIAVVAVGAILTFAMHVHTAGFSVVAIGAILMIVGVVSLVMQLMSLARQRQMTVSQAVASRPVVVRPEPGRVARRAGSYRGYRVGGGSR
jgi:hypothetical protein